MRVEEMGHNLGERLQIGETSSGFVAAPVTVAPRGSRRAEVSFSLLISRALHRGDSACRKAMTRRVNAAYAIDADRGLFESRAEGRQKMQHACSLRLS